MKSFHHPKIDYRGYTMRKKRWAPDMERKIKDVLNIAKTPDEAVQYLKKQGLDDNDVALIMQRFYPNYSCNLLSMRGEQNGIVMQRIPLSSHEQQLELIGFSQNVSAKHVSIYIFHNEKPFHMHSLKPRDHRQQIHMQNQDVHKNLRRNKTGIRLDSVENLSPLYKRPPGFSLVPTLLGTAMQTKFESTSKTPSPVGKRTPSPISYYNHIKDEMQR